MTIVSRLAYALLFQAAIGPLSMPEAESLVRMAQEAVEAGRDSAAYAFWSERLATDPARARLGLATLDRLTYRYEEAERHYQWVIAAPAAPEVARLYATLGLAMLRTQQAHFSEAEPLLRSVLAHPAVSEAAAARAHALMLLGLVLARMARIDSALVSFLEAEATGPVDDEWLRSLVHCNALLVRVRSADAGGAAAARPASLAAIAAGNRRAAAACLAALAQDYERRTQVDSALATLEEVALLHQETRNLSLLAVTWQWQGYILASSGDFAAARRRLDDAVTLGRRTAQHSAVAWAELSLAEIALALGDLTAAGRYASSAAALFTDTGDRWGLAQARKHAGDVALLNRALPAARAAFEEALQEVAPLYPPATVHLRGRLAAVAMFEGDWEGAERELDRAYATAARLDMPEWRQEDGYGRAVLALARGRYAEAVTRLRALEPVLAGVNLGARAELQTRLGEALARGGQLDEAEARLRTAADMLDHWRAGLGARELRATVQHARRFDWDRDLGFATAVAALARAGRIEAAYELTERRRARLLLEEVLRRQVTNSDFGLPGTSSAAVPTMAEWRDILPDATAVLSFLTGSGGEPTTVFVITPAGVTAVEAAPVDEHTPALERFAGLVAAGDLPSELARGLAGTFLGPALAHVPPEIHRLVIIPDGPLHRTPFDALALADGRLLVERFSISLAPSASVAATWWRTPARATRPRLVAFGDAVGTRFAGGDSTAPRLPAAAREVREIARYAARADVYTGAAAREATLRRLPLAEVGMLHFATHADVSEFGVLRSALLLTPGDGEDGRLGVEELSALPLNGCLVVLSACRSGAGAVLAGEGLQGLTAPLLEAGATAVVGTLWQIGDQSAAPFMRLLYRELGQQAMAGDALHGAKRAALAKGLPPSVWAAFTLTGDARLTTSLRPPRAARSYLLGAGVILLGVVYLVARTRRRRNPERS
jgi:tetratricopeptide (TPR) repeat protein